MEKQMIVNAILPSSILLYDIRCVDVNEVYNILVSYCYILNIVKLTILGHLYRMVIEVQT